MTQKMAITLDVNGTEHEIRVEPRKTLSDALRGDCGLTGTNVGCEHGVCGACTILFDGLSARSCLMLAVQANGHALTTVEGLSTGDQMHPLQQALSDHHGLQCGFCTPGMLTTLVELLNDNPSPSAEEVRIAISGNLCRCTGYEGIVAATLDAAAKMRAGAAT